MVDISQFAELVEPRQQSLDPLSSQFPSRTDHERVSYDPDPEDGMDFGIGGDHFDTDGTTFLDIFDTDEYADCRKDNLFYPFASRNEWEVADFLLWSPLSMATINEFSALSMCLESLFSNPLFHDKLDFVPRRVYTTAARVLRVYSEWLTGDFAWDIQNQLPRGATILGTVLSSDKTNITTMTGARVAHPLLLGLANIRMRTRTKLSSRAFLLTALLHIPQYLHPNQWMRGVLEDRLIHKCLVIVLKPLMIAAEIGIMMSDPFGDDFRHPECTRCVTLEQLANIEAYPNNLKAFFEACAEYRLNSIHAPFWMYWPYADPSVFLMPESLHHWHKEFWDHDLHWCLVAVGVLELDFRFSILQTITGYCHFSCGISKLKQVTGRVHRDVQHYIVGLIAGTAPRHFVTTIHALMDNKDVIMSLGARMGAKKPIDNQFIPKLELMQSITASTRKVGALIQWSVDATEHAHISEIKDPARHTNNNDYDPQICRHLDRLEKLWRFEIATTLKSHVVDPGTETEDEGDEGDEEEGTACDDEEPTDPRTALLEELNCTRITTNYFSRAKNITTLSHQASIYPGLPRTFTTGNVAIHLNFNPTRTGMKLDDVSDNFNLPDLRHTLLAFLQHDMRNRNMIHGVRVPRRSLIDRPPILPFDRVQVWHTVRLQQISYHDSSVALPAQTLHASPSSPEWLKGRRDAVLVNIDGQYEWPQSGLKDQYLCYVHNMKIGAVDPVTGMHVVKRAKHANGSPVGDIVPLQQVRSFINLIPQFGAAVDARLTKVTSSHYSSSFF
ncbi:hypothetical protein CY34DRAFT_26962 [Suillus luteus UH-Slu-Lm8-n1]|uniref:DUF6830 domain-containing protein n=1 Tax=Suillus luteus UH-Slu-Lm8-n1 TaxID=930992 RepID=A0A0D0AI46_9AGAM|nr:hypothetical protein CY34DRAFT_26962 [Suillus luteus UH-Slu-Lm8-n1]